MKSTALAADRYFRKFYQHCTQANLDTLFDLLNALHSLNDKLKAESKTNLFASDYFMALKALRNLFHHDVELLHEAKVIPTKEIPGISSDLLFLCLIDGELVDLAFRGPQVRHPDRAARAVKVYGRVVNIHPCLVNCAVDVYEALKAVDALPASLEFMEFKASYDYEELHNIPHYVSGEISCRVADVDIMMRRVFFGET
jgi:hypothetical protein